jgi:BirA family biotin operon repressor/biotin-[acetyl-CoA-carboxylase] ligase
MAFALGPNALAGGYRLAAFETIGSTSAEALKRARAGDKGRLWVTAIAQTEGHGRRGRPWQTPSGNLAASLLMPVAVEGSMAATLGFVAGLALADSIRAVALDKLNVDGTGAKPSPPCGERVARAAGWVRGLANTKAGRDDPSPSRSYGSATPSPQGGGEGAFPFGGGRLQLKWPNDVLIDGAKVAGILLEAVTTPGSSASVVVGIGVNVRHAPEGVPYPATSLAETGVGVTAEALFQALAEAWVEQMGLWDSGRGFAEIRRNWLDLAAGIGGPIAVRAGSEMVRGTFETIDAKGRLVVRGSDGTAKQVTAGEVHFGHALTMAL